MNRRGLNLWTVIASCLVAMGMLPSVSLAQIPEPKQILGFEVGADYHLASYQQAVEYLKALEGASQRLKLYEMGRTAMDRPMIYAVISSEENMANLDRIKEIARRLSLVKGVSDDEARSMASEGKPVVYIDGGLHASECAPAQHNIQLAYDLVSSDDPDIRLIRDNAVLVLVFPNPDGMDLLAEWYQANIGTPYEVSPMPWLYNKYVGHDNNRDSFMVNQVETQHLTRLINDEWYPVVLYNHHQPGMGATSPPYTPDRIWIHPTSEPTNPNVHPLLIRWQTLIGSAMGTAFDREGKAGVISRTRYDTWFPGYVTQSVDGHNIISMLTETRHYPYATPHFYTPNDFPEEFQDLTVSAFYPNPWKGGWWRLKDQVEYCLTGSKAVLHTAALYGEKLLYDKYRMGRDITTRFEKEPPYGWIIPQEQRDAPTAALLLNKLILLGIDVFQADEAFVSDGISYSAGTWVIPMSQPFALFVKNLFEIQEYPDLVHYPHTWQGLVRPQRFPDAYLPPYDVAGWTLPYQMGVKVAAAGSPLEANLSPMDEVEAPAGRLEGNTGYGYLLSPEVNNSFIAVNRILQEGGEVLRAKDGFSAGGRSYLPGTFLVRSGSVARAFMDNLASELHLDVGGTPSQPAAGAYRLTMPRIALYKSWVANMDEGWNRWLFEQYEFPFTNIHDAEVKAGALGERFDVVVIPAMSTNQIVTGHSKGTVPPQYVGGITEPGVKNIREFIEQGGTLVTVNSSCLFAIDELNLPVRDALQGLRPAGRREAPEDTKPPEFACPGSLLRMKFDPSHPVTFGMPQEAPALFNDSPAFTVTASTEGGAPVVVAEYPQENLLMSGYLRGEKHLARKASVVEVPTGAGKIILLGFGVQSRAQPHATFKLLFNSLYYASMQ